MKRHAWTTFVAYLRAPVARTADQSRDEIAEEIAFHLAERTQELVRGGMPVDAARVAAIERFGDPGRVAVACHAGLLRGLAMWHRLHLAVTVALIAAVAMLWIGALGRRVDLSPPLPAGIASMLDNDWTGDVVGRVCDEHGAPLAGAHLLVVVKTWPDQSYFQRAYAAVSGPDGGFRINDVYPVDDRYAVQATVVAEHRELKSSYQQQDGGALAALDFRLTRSPGLDLQVEARPGDALAGVEILPHGRVEVTGAEHTVYFDSAQPIIRRTDGRGRVALPYFQPGDRATVLVRAPEGEWESRDLVVPPAGQTATIHMSLSKDRNPGET